MIGLLLATMVAGCKGQGAKCVPGASVECACPGGAKGVQVCKSDGTFEPCQCQQGAAAEPPASAEANEAKTMEASQLVRRLYSGARAYYMDTPQPDLTPIDPQFPDPSIGPTPPLGECCKQGGMCKPRAWLWDQEVWLALKFYVDEPHYYSYEYKTIDPTRSFTVRAYGDLDCDGVYSTFEMHGEINDENPDGLSGNASLARSKPLE